MDEEGISVSVTLMQLIDLYEKSVRVLTNINRIEQGHRQYILWRLAYLCQRGFVVDREGKVPGRSRVALNQ